MLRATGLTKRYGPTLALDRLSLEVPAGAVFGLLGPNGSGKSTFLKLVMGFIFPDAGEIDRGGLPPCRIGYLAEHAFYPPRFSVRDYLTTLGRLSGLRGAELRRQVSQLLAQLGLADVGGRWLGTLSRGLLQRVGLAQALLGDPPLLLLDEPVLGLDPAAQKFMRDQIFSLRHSGKTVFLCTHHLDEVTRVCSHVAVLKQGRLILGGAALDRVLNAQGRVIILTGPLPPDLPARLAELSSDVVVTGQQVTLPAKARALRTEVLRVLLHAGVDIQRLEEQHETLEELYLKVTASPS